MFENGDVPSNCCHTASLQKKVQIIKLIDQKYQNEKNRESISFIETRFDGKLMNTGISR